MPQIYLCFLWHMHQPFYKDLVSGEYKLPWTRMHALKDYYGMVRILEEFPQVRQTFNLVPSMMAQVAEYASGEARDPFLEAALKPAEELTEDERAFLLRHSFYSDPQRMIYRYPRYGELYDAWQAQKQSGSRASVRRRRISAICRCGRSLPGSTRSSRRRTPEVREWVARGRNFTPGRPARAWARSSARSWARCCRSTGSWRRTGQIEISTTPYYHPILPLLCDSNIASVAHPSVPLPPRFRYPERCPHAARAGARVHCARSSARRRWACGRRKARSPTRFSPSPRSWASNGPPPIAACSTARWGEAVRVDGLYRPYRWQQGGRSLGVIFRDHFLSDLIGFVYSKMDAAAAAEDFLRRIRDNCAGILGAGRDALVPIILDGENAWEYYDHNGRPFLRELYRRISRGWPHAAR